MEIEHSSDDEPLETSGTSSNFSLPRASVQRIVKGVTSDVKFTNETIDLMTECCVEFLQLISSESNEICTKENKQLISPQHVSSALKQLGFESYIQQVEDACKNHKTKVQERPKRKSKLETLGIPTEELLKEQQKLFAQAKFVSQAVSLIGRSALQLQKKEDETK